VFDQNVPRVINDPTNKAPYTAHFQPERGNLQQIMHPVTDAGDPLAAGGTWTVRITKHQMTMDMTPDMLSYVALRFTSHLTPNSETTVAIGAIRDGVNRGNYATKPAYQPDVGVGPSPAIASDNTLGSYSAYQGRLYVTYASPNDTLFGLVNSIQMVTSDDGGQTWIPQGPVNDDSAADGFSEGNRPKFEASVAVDQYTGTAVVSYYDGRYDPAQARMVETLAASIDGGVTWTKQVGAWANQSLTAIDGITGKVVTLQPIPDNESSGNSSRDTLFNYGDHQGLVVIKGVITPIWTGNLNGALGMNPILATIYAAKAVIAAGPRIVASTMGPAQAVSTSGFVFNNTFNTDGVPNVDGFSVTFDRYVDPGTFDISSVQVKYHDTNPNSGYVDIPVDQVIPLDNTGFGAMSFFIHFMHAQNGTGTYSYVILPGIMVGNQFVPTIRDRIRWPDGVTLGNFMDQNANAVTAESPSPSSGGDSYATPTPLKNGPNFLAPYSQDTLPIIVPGPHVVSTSVPGNPVTPDNLVMNKTVSTLEVKFDRKIDKSSFTSGKILRMIGPAGEIKGPFNVTPDPNDPDQAFPRSFYITFSQPLALSGTYTLTLASSIQARNGDQLDTNENAGVDILFQKPSAGTTPITYPNTTQTQILANTQTESDIFIDVATDNYVIQGLTVKLNISFSDTRKLQAKLVGPDGTEIELFTDVGTLNAHTNFIDTILDDNATKPDGTPNLIQNGLSPFTGSYTPQQALSALKGKLVSGLYRLVLTNEDATIVGTLNNWSLTFQKAVSVSGLGEPVADQTTVSFRIFTDAKNIPISHQVWTAVGSASINNTSDSGRIGGLAVDPSDPSGNTVYAAGASGGVWKTSNFLTNSPSGPTWQPLTDLGATFGINIGGIDVFPRNNDPKQTVVFVSTGEGDTYTPGAGFLRSMDGGATWTLLDSTDNTLPFAQRDHAFNKDGTYAYKIVADPKPAPGGQNKVIVYAVLSGTNGGIWKSLDSGDHWQLMRAGDATDLVLAPGSADVATGNLDLVYAAFRGEGVFSSPAGGNGWNLMAGGVGDPLIHNIVSGNVVTVTAPADTPNGAKGRIVLATPALTGNKAQDLNYESWLYAYVATAVPKGSIGGFTDGLYMTKDFGQNWVKVKIQAVPVLPDPKVPTIPTNDDLQPNVDILGDNVTPGGVKQANYDMSIAIDPTNPNIVYLGGTFDPRPHYTIIRVDTTGIEDAHSMTAFNNFRNDGGQLMRSTKGGIQFGPPNLDFKFPYGYPPTSPVPYLNFFRDPNAPFTADTSLNVFNVTNFNNEGLRQATSPWYDFSVIGFGSTDQHRLITMLDPLTGHTRLIVGDDQGLFTAVAKDDGTLDLGIGTAQDPNTSRNGNLQITQFYGGAAQPSQSAANQSGTSGFFYGAAQDDGYPNSAKDVLSTGNILWTGPVGDATAVHTDQTGSGVVFHYVWPCCGGGTFGTSFFQVDGVGHTLGLLQAGDDPFHDMGQWRSTGGHNFAVNPINKNEVVISSNAGRVFRTQNNGSYTWFVIGEPSVLDGTPADALAFGAPNPGDPVGVQDNFIYAGTRNGNIFVTLNGGGTWIKFGTTSGLDGSPVQEIAPSTHRGSHEAYAVTNLGVYYCADSSNPASKWVNITGNVFQITIAPFGDLSAAATRLKSLSTIVADWRYTILDDPTNPNGPTHPILYVGGDGGVYRSMDKGKTWTIFPSIAQNGAPVDGGYLPNANVTHLDLSVGNINPATGQPDPTTSEDILLATTYGRGEFMIRLQAPGPLEETFVIGLNNQVYAQKLDATGHPIGGYFLTTPGEVLDLRVGRTAAGLPELFVKGLNNQIYAQKIDPNGNSAGPYFFTATGQIKTFEVGNDASGAPEVFAIGLNDQVYSLKFTADGDPNGGFNFTTTGQVKQIQVGHDTSNRPELFVVGLDDQIYYQKFDGAGNSASPYLFVDAGQVKSIKVGETQNGTPEIFAVGLDDQVYGHHFTANGDSDHLNFFLAFFQPGNPFGTLYQVKSITLGHDANNNPELFAVGLDDQVYVERYLADGNPDPTGYFNAAQGQIKKIEVAFDANNNPELIAIGLDDAVYYATFDFRGLPLTPYARLADGQVLDVHTTH
jgi:hypothetical protein